jgi:hypothetical protein
MEVAGSGLANKQSLDVVVGLDTFLEQFRSQLENAGPPESEHAIHFCLALGLQAAYRFPPGAIVFERRAVKGRLDLWVIPLDLAIEVKYQRPIPSGRNQPVTQLFGGLLADLNKVARSDATNRVVLYVADPIGVQYLQKSAHTLLPLILGQRSRISSEDIAALPATAASKAVEDGDWLPLTAELIWNRICEKWQAFAWQVAPL